MGGIGQVDLADLEGDGKGEGKGEGKGTQTKREREQDERREKSLSDRLQGCFDRIAEALEQRGDEELADIVREDARVMAGGLMSLTRPFKPVRTAVLLFVSIIEPALAFGRILRVMLGRWAASRAAEQAEREGQEPQPPEQYPPVT